MSHFSFSDRLLAWFDQHGRKDLPWQHPRHPYRVWLSEVMLQQTQVSSVIPYFLRFIERFPNRASLAQASQDEVLSLWSGLGYYARGRNLHRCAQELEQLYGDQWPQNLDQWLALPGIGRSTAGAILAQAFGLRATLLDGNVKRVLSRYRAIEGYPGTKAVEQQLWQLAEQLTPYQRLADYSQAMMDLGASLCSRTKPNCNACPLQDDCLAHQQGQPLRYPGKKPKPERPQRTCVMLILQREDGRVLLQQRPPVGIWGGLYAFPEVTPDSDWVRFCQQQFDLQIQEQELWPAFTHKFSHFDLLIQPAYARVRPQQQQVMAGLGQLWYKDELAGLPKPVQSLLETLESRGKIDDTYGFL
jgi:A/G-specific adenine glycosylase